MEFAGCRRLVCRHLWFRPSCDRHHRHFPRWGAVGISICIADKRVCNVVFTNAGWSSSVARWAHNPEVAGSNPVPATNTKNPRPGLPGGGSCYEPGPVHGGVSRRNAAGGGARRRRGRGRRDVGSRSRKISAPPAPMRAISDRQSLTALDPGVRARGCRRFPRCGWPDRHPGSRPGPDRRRKHTKSARAYHLGTLTTAADQAI